MLVHVALLLLAVLAVAAFAAVGRPALATRRLAAEAERKCPPAGKFVEVDGNRIHHVDQGEGRPIVFLHGLGAQLCHFTGPLFPIFGPGYRLVALDRPGSGYSTRARGASGGLSEQARVVRCFIEKLGLEKPLVVGHSLGGAIALTLAVEHPEAISGIALMSPLTHMESALRPEFKALWIPSRLLRWIVSYTIAVPRSFEYAEATLAFIFGPQAVSPDYLVEGGGWIGLRPSHFYATSTDMAAVEKDLGRIEARYGEIAVPVFADSAIGHALDLNGAIRRTDYSTSGAVTTWKLGAVYEPIAGVRFRATRSRDIRAPNLSELFGPRTRRTIGLTDPLTGLQNRRALVDGYPDKAFGEDLAVVMFDLDHFKNTNDAYGHSAGDEVLKRFADVIRTNLRAGDSAFRLGGEEFALVIARVEGSYVEAAARNILADFAGQEIHTQVGVLRCTVSAGIAFGSMNRATLSEMLTRADRALYQAKRAGRNRVVVDGWITEPARRPALRA